MNLLQEMWTVGGTKFYWFRRALAGKLRSWWERVTGFNPYNVQPGGLCPVQADGLTKDGKWYYFRSRGTTASMTICESEGAYFTPDVEFAFSRELTYGNCYEAGYLSRADAIRLATIWLNEYYELTKTNLK